MIENNLVIDNMFSKNDLTLIHKNTIDLLENEGVIVDNDKALKIFEDNGIKTEGKKVFISEEKIEETIDQIPNKFELKARNPNNNIEIGNDASILGPPLGPPFVYENGERNYGTYKDYIEIVKYCQTNPYIDLVGGDMIAPTDIDKDQRHKKMLYAAVKYSDKALIGIGSGQTETKDLINMGELIFGQKELENNNYILKLVGASSPLEYNNTALNTLMNLAEYSQPISIYSQILAGMTGPITLAGLLTQQNAEILLGAALVQLISPKTPVIYATTSSVTDMKSGNITVGNGQYAKIIKGVAEIADYYEIPSMVAGGVTDSEKSNNQAGFESMLNIYTSIASSIDIIIYSAGGLSDYLGVSYDKMLNDFSLLESLQNFQKGIEVNDKTIAEETIKEVGAGNNFMTSQHTMARLEQRIGKKNEINKDILKNYSIPSLDSKIEKDLKRY